MYAWDDGVVACGKVKREIGSWGLVVTHKTGGKTGKETIEVNECGTLPIPEEVRMSDQMGSVGMSCGITINMKNFESARVDCWVTLPCKEDEMEAGYQRCYDFASQKVKAYADRKIVERDGTEGTP